MILQRIIRLRKLRITIEIHIREKSLKPQEINPLEIYVYYRDNVHHLVV